MTLKNYTELPKNLFGLLYWNIFGVYFFIFFIIGLLSLMGVRPIEFNGQDTYGFLGLVVALVMGPFMALVTTFATWIILIVGNFVLKVFVKIKGGKKSI